MRSEKSKVRTTAAGNFQFVGFGLDQRAREFNPEIDVLV
jgi:hypothetical protein